MKHKSISQAKQNQCCTKPGPQAASRGLSTMPPAYGVAVADQPPAILQAKLTIGQPGDRYEREADALAGQVMRRISGNPAPEAPGRGEYGEHGQILRKEAAPPAISSIGSSGGGMEASDSFARSLQNAGSGSPLPTDARAEMEAAFGRDFSGVQIHADARAAQMSRSIDALAFTHGQHIYFNHGQYQPDSPEGKRLLAHELVHVGQQTDGKVAVQNFTHVQRIPRFGTSTGPVFGFEKKKPEEDETDQRFAPLPSPNDFDKLNQEKKKEKSNPQHKFEFFAIVPVFPHKKSKPTFGSLENTTISFRLEDVRDEPPSDLFNHQIDTYKLEVIMPWLQLNLLKHKFPRNAGAFDLSSGITTTNTFAIDKNKFSPSIRADANLEAKFKLDLLRAVRSHYQLNLFLESKAELNFGRTFSPKGEQEGNPRLSGQLGLGLQLTPRHLPIFIILRGNGNVKAHFLDKDSPYKFKITGALDLGIRF